jgi:hypothetical protein
MQQYHRPNVGISILFLNPLRPIEQLAALKSYCSDVKVSLYLLLTPVIVTHLSLLWHCDVPLVAKATV